MQNNVTEKQRLLDSNGNIKNPGYSKSLVWEYSRDDIKAKKSRIKEWDYYYISDGRYALCLTIADMGYVGANSISVIDFAKPWQATNSDIILFPMGKLKMPTVSDIGNCYAKAGKSEFTFENDGETRHLHGYYKNYDKKGNDLSYDIVIKDAPKETMVIATPFDKDKYFYYNQKINCMTASGWFMINDQQFNFDEKETLATLDWGRGVWTYDNTWYWGSLQTRLKDGSTFGFNIGYGFGNTSAASENMLFYNGTSHKLEDVDFGIPNDNQKGVEPSYMHKWHFTSSDNRLDLIFEPIIDRYEPFDLKVMCMIPHQVFGRFYGKCILDDGKVIELNGDLGFAEKVHNKW